MAVVWLKLLGFPMKNIRGCLSKLTDVTHGEIAKQGGVSRSQVTMTISGQRCQRNMQEVVASAYNTPVEVMFPKNECRRNRAAA